MSLNSKIKKKVNSESIQIWKLSRTKPQKSLKMRLLLRRPASKAALTRQGHDMKKFLAMLALFVLMPAAQAASDFDIRVVVGDPGRVWVTLDSATQNLIVFVTGVGMLAAIIATILSFQAHSIKGSAGEHMDIQGSRQTALSGMLMTAGYFLGMLFFIGLIGLIFKLYG
ncbi:hypothetical protein ANME2D_02440 [Candidatus Methanoperedens nitroreducens]|uniref:Uncharacterized protein n=1 Tax=Candidatus Methanoperedens nitratireducens TaxID=1392998 RepID=A0A062V613_9EURY|nr:hypothetical protein [Candidatus Methanoperedens nitroreducens]KCZ71239.1 hypothetical protein ANME2D_02440 [Candidatus Methanoperedens nitroreducens]MDJ1420335.1 hypothetical protein [Candidatus Methanoperedens sp.]